MSLFCDVHDNVDKKISKSHDLKLNQTEQIWHFSDMPDKSETFCTESPKAENWHYRRKIR
jgi:hypothetical protein